MIDFDMGNLQLIGILAASVSKGGYGPWNPHFKLEKNKFLLGFTKNELILLKNSPISFSDSF